MDHSRSPARNEPLRLSVACLSGAGEHLHKRALVQPVLERLHSVHNNNRDLLSVAHGCVVVLFDINLAPLEATGRLKLFQLLPDAVAKTAARFGVDDDLIFPGQA